MSGVLMVFILALVLVAAIRLASSRPRPVADQDRAALTKACIDSLLPQTQCGKCHYSGCRPYAEAIARGEANINMCPPGGEATMRAIARLLGREPVSFPGVVSGEETAFVALIDEDLCIGCVKCINACPVDAIIGAPKLMHTVIKQHCTGCELCIAPCPVDCISMAPVRVKTREWVWSKPDPALRLRG